MSEFDMYFLKTNVALAMFYLMYRLFFNGDTHWKARRIYFLSAVFVSFVFSLISLDDWLSRRETVQTFIVEYVQLQEMEIAQTPPPAFNLQDILRIAYVFIGGLFLFRMIAQLIPIFVWRLNGKKQRLNGIKIIRLNEKVNPFSFFGWIFINPELHDEYEQKEILAHEHTHVRQLHSIDMIIGELLSAVCWLNPVAWLLRNEIRRNLEFLADDCVLQAGYNPRNYQYHLLRLASEDSAKINLVNNFNVLPLKKRITMMNKEKTSKKGLLKYALIVPLTLVLILTSNVQTIMASVEEAMKTEEKDAPKKDGVYDEVDIPPVFPGGDGELLKYLAGNLKYPADAAKNNIQGRVVIRFIVSATGEVTDVEVLSSLYPSCDEEAVRIVKEMPKWTPGVQDGKNVDVYYAIPISFRLAGGKNTPTDKNEIVVVGYGENGSTITDNKITLGYPPLIILDGKRMPDNYGINSISPDNIESIEVLKDESATTNYGEAGKNGVIIITTKKKEKVVDTYEAVIVGRDENNVVIVGYDENKKDKHVSIIMNNRVSLEGKSPLIVLDGERMPSDFDVHSISPDNIESLAVLKDAAATTTYGEAGKDGVVLITTKKK